MITAKTVAYSQSPQGHKLWTGLLTFPKYLLAEAKTHRIISQDTDEVIIESKDVSLNAARELSKNSASSRAIPFNRIIQSVKDNPFIPIAWMKEHKGMQGTEYFTDIEDIENFKTNHLIARDKAIEIAIAQSESGITKQICNRYLEYFMYTTVLISGTEWENFFELRCPQYLQQGKIYRSKKDAIAKWPSNKDGLPKTELDWLQVNTGQAEIHMMALAEAIWDAQNESIPKQLKAGEWHIPFGDIIIDKIKKDAYYEMNEYLPVKIGTAMAARTSYTIVGDEKEIGYDKLIGIHDRMEVARPFHASPFEHCAQAMYNSKYHFNIKGEGSPDSGTDALYFNSTEKGWCRNFRGFIQYRHIIESRNETKSEKS